MNINGYIGFYDLNNRLANKAGIDKKMSYENIGKKYNVSHTTIRRWFLKYKI